MPGGVRRLLLAAVPSPVAYVQQHLTSTEKLTLAASPYPTTKALLRRLPARGRRQRPLSHEA